MIDLLLGCEGLTGLSVGAVPQGTVATNLNSDLRSVSDGVLGAPFAPQRVNSKLQLLKGPRQGDITGKGLQSKSALSRGHGRIIPTTTAP